MKHRDSQAPFDFFEYVRVQGPAPQGQRDRIDVAVLDMNHAWPNVGHDAVVNAVLGVAGEFQQQLAGAGVKVRALSYDVRRSDAIPAAPDGQLQLYLATGGPGHLDPRQNDGLSLSSQGVREETTWEAPLFRLFEAIVRHPSAALIAICHSFGLLCRWSGVARPVLRETKSSGLPLNVLSDAAAQHPWFRRFASELSDGRHFRVIDNRLFDLIVENPGGANCIAFAGDASAALTLVEFARDAEGMMPRVFGMNYHPEIIDRQHILSVLEEKLAHGEVSDEWFQERATTLRDLLQGENERQSQLTSRYTFLEPLRHHLGRLVAERCGVHSAA